MKKNKYNITQIIRHIIQLLSFIIFPGLFILTWNAIKVLFIALINNTFTLDTMLVPILTLVAVIPTTMLWGRFFCGYLCAFGSMQELLNYIAKKLKIKQININYKLDKYLKYIKYIIIVILIILWILNITLDTINPWNIFGIYSSYKGWTDLSAFISIGGFILLLIIISSLFIERVFCRYLCPLGGVFTLISKLRLFNIKKDLNKCIDCNLCSKKCPMNIDVNKETSEYNKVKSSECIDCFKCINTCPVNALYTKPNEALTGSIAALTIAGLYYGGTLIANSNITNNNVNNPVITTGKYKDGTYYGTGNGYRGEVKVKVIVDKGSITSITIESYKDDDQFFNKAKNTIINNIITTQSTDVATVSGATYSSKGIISAVINALDLTNNIESDNEEPSNNTFTNLVDGTYEGTGTGRNGDIVVSVVVKDKKVTSITIESSREDTRYINAAKDTIINNIISKQSLDVDTVSGATMSSNGIIDAVANALNISFTNPNDALNNKGQHHNRPNK